MWTSIFEGIGDLFTNVITAPLLALSKVETANWWLGNLITFIFIIICTVAFIYWLKQLQIFKNNREDEQDTTAHSFLK